MAADLHIHVLEGLTERDLRAFFSNTLGSKWFNPVSEAKPMDLYAKIDATPSIWIGEVSWLKAALFDDEDAYVPSPVAVVSEVIGEDLPIIDNALIARVLAAFTEKNITKYDVTEPEKVKEFLEEHKGKRVFTVSW